MTGGFRHPDVHNVLIVAVPAGMGDTDAKRAGELARGGFRVLAVAEADRPDQAGQPGPGMERRLRLLGLTAILDPPRPASAATIASCQAAGITPLLITGDHPATARRP